MLFKRVYYYLLTTLSNFILIKWKILLNKLLSLKNFALSKPTVNKTQDTSYCFRTNHQERMLVSFNRDPIYSFVCFSICSRYQSSFLYRKWDMEDWWVFKSFFHSHFYIFQNCCFQSVQFSLSRIYNFLNVSLFP